MKVQIYTVQSIEEAESLLNLGVDNIGLTPASIGLPGEITVELQNQFLLQLKAVTILLYQSQIMLMKF